MAKNFLINQNIGQKIASHTLATSMEFKIADVINVTDRVAKTWCRELLESAEHRYTNERFH